MEGLRLYFYAGKIDHFSFTYKEINNESFAANRLQLVALLHYALFTLVVNKNII